jgi:phosphoserine phosphatase
MKKNIIALIYDFDGTLSPQPMQEYTVFPELGIKPRVFWDEVKLENKKIRGEEIITYMMLMLKKANNAHLKISKSDLGKMAGNVVFFPGVENFFRRMNKFVSKESKGKIKVRHYIISSGLKEIINKTKIKGNIYKIFASEYQYDEYNAPSYPKLVVTDTVKTQFLFRINKGKEDLLESINEYMAEEDRPIPFSNMIYIGDGLTDVPCMTVATKNNGYAIAVFKPKIKNGLKTCKMLFSKARVDYIAPADYRRNSELDKFIKILLKTIIQGIIVYNSQRDMVIKRKIGEA